MRLLTNDFTTAETTLGGSTAAIGLIGSGSSAHGGRNLRIQRVLVVCGGTTVAANSSGGIMFRYGDSSAGTFSTILFPTPHAGGDTTAVFTAPFTVELNDMNIRARFYEFETNEAAHGGWSVHVWGD